MSKLSESELDLGFESLKSHPYNTLFPSPYEWEIVTRNWTVIRQQLSLLDLYNYKPKPSVELYFPKQRNSFRIANLLHPYDAILYASLVRHFRDNIEAARDPFSFRRVFSFRAPINKESPKLYDDAIINAFRLYREAIRKGTELYSNGFIAITDIVDFFPRLDQHRLVNAVTATCKTDHDLKMASFLEKMLFGFSGGKSRGIPVGCAASRLLAEALLIDVDEHLISEEIPFCRRVDDFVLFGSSESSVRRSLFELAKWLQDQHGLSLNSSKTKILPNSKAIEFLFPESTMAQAERRTRLSLPTDLHVDPYAETTVEPITEDRFLEKVSEEITTDFMRLVNEITNNRNTPYYELEIILRRMQGVKNTQIARACMENISRLEPIAISISKYLSSISEKLTEVERSELSSLLLDYLDASDPIDYVWVWLLSIYEGSTNWNERQKLANLSKKRDRSPTVLRSLCLAQRVNGSRSDILHLKDYGSRTTSLVRTAVLLATTHLPKDERKNWVRYLDLKDKLEKLASLE